MVSSTIDDWPDPPTRWSFSALTRVEECPRRWSLRKRGAPRCATGAATSSGPWGSVRGRAAHEVLELLLQIHQRHGGPPAGSPALPDFWRTHLPQGLRALVRDHIAEEVRRSKEIPAPVAERMLRLVEDQVPALVSVVGAMFRATLDALPRAGDAAPIVEPEVEVHARLSEGPGGDWFGKIDAVVRRGVDAVLIDFKTGARKDRDIAQLRAYACLFACAPRVNQGASVRRLLLFYGQGAPVPVDVPDAAGVEAESASLSHRAEDSAIALRERPPRAVTTLEGCSTCDVRASCDAYWQAREAWGQPDGRPIVDVEATVTRVRLRGREATVAVGDREVEVLFAEPHRPRVASLRPGARVRLVDARPELPGDITARDAREVLSLGEGGALDVLEVSGPPGA